MLEHYSERMKQNFISAQSEFNVDILLFQLLDCHFVIVTMFKFLTQEFENMLITSTVYNYLENLKTFGGSNVLGIKMPV
jgi:hypothetical protein